MLNTIRSAGLLFVSLLYLVPASVSHAQYNLYTPTTPAAWTFNTNLPPLSYFDGDNSAKPHYDDRNLINAYLLTYLSDAIYADGLYSTSAWEAELRERLTEFGATRVEFHAHNATGAEVAAVETSDSLIIVHRGSHFFGTGWSPIAFTGTDWYHDLNATANVRTIDGLSMNIHEGFWHSSNSVFGWVKEQAMTAADDGKYIWVTGHSLGGASATLTAARLHYEEGIPVQGLHTFGSPKVGDLNLQKLFTESGVGGVVLKDRTQRWVVDGDIATTLFYRYRRPTWFRSWTGFNYLGFVSIYYRHVGQTNEMQRVITPHEEIFTVDWATIDRSNNMYAVPASLGGGGEHGAYTPGIRALMIDRLDNEETENTLADILDGH